MPTGLFISKPRADVLYQPKDADLTAVAALNSTGFARQAGAGTWAIVGETGSDEVVRKTSPTLVTPTVASFVNAAHTHQNAAGGGTLDHGAALTGLADDDHTQYALLTPGASTRNVIQPSGNFKALVVKNNASQAVAPFELQSSAGTPLAWIDKDGNLYVGHGGNGKIYLGSNELVIQQNPSFPYQFQFGSHFTLAPGSVMAVGGAASIAAALSVYSVGYPTVTPLYVDLDDAQTGDALDIRHANLSATPDFHVFANGGFAANDRGLDIDSWIEGDTDPALFYVNAGLDAVGVGVSAPNASAKLQIDSTTKGFAPPRMTTTQRDTVSTPLAGLVIYNTTTNVLNFYNGSAWGAV